MNIFFLGKFSRPYSTENYVAYAMRSLGHEVTCEQFSPRMNGDEAFNRVKESRAEMVLFSKPRAQCYGELIRNCKRAGIVTVTWLWDLYFSYRHYRGGQSRMPPGQALLSDYVFSTDGGHESCWRETQIKHQVVRQGVHEPEHVMMPPSGVRHPLAFVGTWRKEIANQERLRLVRWLRANYGDAISFHDSTRGLALNQLLTDTDVVVGDSYPADHYWSNRIYEILGRGGFLLHPRTIGLDTEFRDGEHYAGYDRGDWSGLRERIDYWLGHADERERIRQVGFERAGQYTYTSRCSVMINHIVLSQ